jgi:protein transport protein SEC13
VRARKEEENGAWSKLFDQVLHESSVNSIAWAPHVFGLILATASADGKVCVLSYKPESNAWERDVIQVRARGVKVRHFLQHWQCTNMFQ